MLGAAGNLGGWAEACSQFYQLVALAMEPHAAASWEAIDLQGTFSLYPFLSHLIPIPNRSILLLTLLAPLPLQAPQLASSSEESTHPVSRRKEGVDASPYLSQMHAEVVAGAIMQAMISVSDNVRPSNATQHKLTNVTGLACH